MVIIRSPNKNILDGSRHKKKDKENEQEGVKIVRNTNVLPLLKKRFEDTPFGSGPMAEDINHVMKNDDVHASENEKRFKCGEVSTSLQVPHPLSIIAQDIANKNSSTRNISCNSSYEAMPLHDIGKNICKKMPIEPSFRPFEDQESFASSSLLVPLTYSEQCLELPSSHEIADRSTTAYDTSTDASETIESNDLCKVLSVKQSPIMDILTESSPNSSIVSPLGTVSEVNSMTTCFNYRSETALSDQMASEITIPASQEKPFDRCAQYIITPQNSIQPPTTNISTGSLLDTPLGNGSDDNSMITHFNSLSQTPSADQTSKISIAAPQDQHYERCKKDYPLVNHGDAEEDVYLNEDIEVDKSIQPSMCGPATSELAIKTACSEFHQLLQTNCRIKAEPSRKLFSERMRDFKKIKKDACHVSFKINQILGRNDEMDRASIINHCNQLKYHIALTTRVIKNADRALVAFNKQFVKYSEELFQSNSSVSERLRETVDFVVEQKLKN